MQDAKRGFSSFIGKTVKDVDATAINVVRILFTDGTVKEIWAEDRIECGIEVITANDSEDDTGFNT